MIEKHQTRVTHKSHETCFAGQRNKTNPNYVIYAIGCMKVANPLILISCTSTATAAHYFVKLDYKLKLLIACVWLYWLETKNGLLGNYNSPATN